MAIPQPGFKPRVVLCQMQSQIWQERPRASPRAPHRHRRVRIQELSSPLIHPCASRYWSYHDCSPCSPHLWPPQLGDQQDSFTLIINSWPLSENREGRGQPSPRAARVRRLMAGSVVPASPAPSPDTQPRVAFPSSPAPNQLTK